MKIIILCVLISIISMPAAMATRRAPHKICLKTQIDPTVKTGLLQMELSYPGQGGIYSGDIGLNAGYTCMHPYDWKTAPSGFVMYGVHHTTWEASYDACSDMMTNKNNGLPTPAAEYYTLTDPDRNGHFGCHFDGNHPAN